MDPRKAAIVSLLDRTKKLEGIRVDGATILQLRARQKEAGRRVVDGPLRGILDPSTFATVQRSILTGCYADGLELCVPVAGFGSILCEAVVCTLGKAHTEHEWVLDWAALWNLLVAYFDELCDEYGSLLPLLLARISPTSLRAALSPDSNEHLTPEAADPVLLRFVVEIADEVFSRFRLLSNRLSGQDFRRLSQSIEKAYLSEIIMAELRFSALTDLEDVRKHLHDSSSLPVWILGCTSALAAGCAPLPDGLQSSLGFIGDVLWLLDDLVDLEDDVGTDRWNSVFLVAAERDGPSVLSELRLLPPEDRLMWLHENDMANTLADRIFERLNLALDDLDNTFGRGTPLAADLVSILWSFANEIP